MASRISPVTGLISIASFEKSIGSLGSGLGSGCGVVHNSFLSN